MSHTFYGWPVVLKQNSADRESAIRELLEQGRAKLVATTLGADGCILVTR